MPGKSCNCQVSRNSPFRKLTALKHLSSVGRSGLWILSSWAQSKFDAKRKQHVTSQPPTSSSVWSCASKLASCGCDVHAVGVGSPDQLRARLVRSSLSGHGLGKVEKLHDSSRKKTALSTLRIEDGRSSLWILSSWVQNKFDALFLLQIFHHQLGRSLLFQLLWIQTDACGDGILALVCNSCNKTSPGTKYLKQKRWRRGVFRDVLPACFLGGCDRNGNA